eukprot:1148296-Pelagomonas_calceolata.AAC.4
MAGRSQCYNIQQHQDVQASTIHKIGGSILRTGGSGKQKEHSWSIHTHTTLRYAHHLETHIVPWGTEDSIGSLRVTENTNRCRGTENGTESDTHPTLGHTEQQQDQILGHRGQHWVRHTACLGSWRTPTGLPTL